MGTESNWFDPGRAADVQPVPKRKARGLTEAEFNTLLDRLDRDRTLAGERYKRLHNKLVKFFTYEGSDCPEDSADETINRVARRLEDGEGIQYLDRYALGVARLVYKEDLQRQRVARAAVLEVLRQTEDASGKQRSEARIAALQSCLDRLSPDSRDLILRYYRGERTSKIDNRKKLAQELGVPPNALRNRVFRLREKLERCLESAMSRNS
jgi:RNA polymerase sigma factor (sigma-70 family)